MNIKKLDMYELQLKLKEWFEVDELTQIDFFNDLYTIHGDREFPYFLLILTILIFSSNTFEEMKKKLRNLMILMT